MSTQLWISQMLYMIIAASSFILVYQFLISKDGVLRKIMVFYWACQFWATAWSGLWFFMQYKGFPPTGFGVGRIIALIPLAISMIILMIYLIRQNNRKIKNHRL